MILSHRDRKIRTAFFHTSPPVDHRVLMGTFQGVRSQYLTVATRKLTGTTRAHVVKTILVVGSWVYLGVAIREQFTGDVAAVTLGQMFVLHVFVARMGGFNGGLQFSVRTALLCLPFVRERHHVRFDVPLGCVHVVVLIAVIRSAQSLRADHKKLC